MISDVARKVYDETNMGEVGKCVTVARLNELGFSNDAIGKAQGTSEIVILQHPGNARRFDVCLTEKTWRAIRLEDLKF